MITIRQAVYEEIPRIMQFIDEHWKKNHILAKDRELFEWQFTRDKEVFYLVAEEVATGDFYATMGYIPMNYGTENYYISPVMICTLKHPDYPMLGSDLGRHYENNMGVKNVVSVGLEKRYAKALSILYPERMGWMKQYYRLNDVGTYSIAHVEDNYIRPVSGNAKLEVCDDYDSFIDYIGEEALKNREPYESGEYIKHRFFEHPYYNYTVFKIVSDIYKGVIIGREIDVNGAKIFRIVDYLGQDECLSEVGCALDTMMKQNEYEYIDFYCYGIAEEILEKAGFVERTKDSTNIIPNYFEPFEQKNVDLNFFTFNKDNLHVYRGMSDQDRPNIIKNREAL